MALKKANFVLKPSRIRRRFKLKAPEKSIGSERTLFCGAALTLTRPSEGNAVKAANLIFFFSLFMCFHLPPTEQQQTEQTRREGRSGGGKGEMRRTG